MDEYPVLAGDSAEDFMKKDVKDKELRYQFHCEIIDTESGEIVASGSTLIPNEKRVGTPILGLEVINEDAAESEFWSTMRYFRNRVQLIIEADENNVDEIL